MRSDDEAACHEMTQHYTVNCRCKRQLLHWQMERLQHTQLGSVTVLLISADNTSTITTFIITV